MVIVLLFWGSKKCQCIYVVIFEALHMELFIFPNFVLNPITLPDSILLPTDYVTSYHHYDARPCSYPIWSPDYNPKTLILKFSFNFWSAFVHTTSNWHSFIHNYYHLSFFHSYATTTTFLHQQWVQSANTNLYYSESTMHCPGRWGHMFAAIGSG